MRLFLLMSERVKLMAFCVVACSAASGLGAQTPPSRPNRVRASAPPAVGRDSSRVAGPADVDVLRMLRDSSATKSEALMNAVCPLTLGSSIAVDTARVTRRGTFNAGGAGAGATGVAVAGAQGYWPVEVALEGRCRGTGAVAQFLQVADKPFSALVQLRFSRDDFGDLVGTLVKADAQPAPVLWMRANLVNLAVAERAFAQQHRRYSHSLERLRFRPEGGAGAPVILAHADSFTAFITHQDRPDTVCMLAAGAGAPACMSRQDVEGTIGGEIPVRGFEPQWPVGSKTVEMLTGEYPGVSVIPTVTWDSLRSTSPRGAVDAGVTPFRLWDYLHADAVRSKYKVVAGTRDELFMIIEQRKAFVGSIRIYLAIRGDSANAPRSTLDMQVFAGGLLIDPRGGQKVVDAEIVQIKQDLPIR